QSAYGFPIRYKESSHAFKLMALPRNFSTGPALRRVRLALAGALDKRRQRELPCSCPNSTIKEWNMTSNIQGTCDPKFSPVRDAFAVNFESGGEVGAAAAIVLDGRPVVDLCAGYADKAKSRPWTRDTLVNVYSTTKGLAAICAHRLVDQGKLDLDAPVARYWPEFAQAGKEKLPVRFLLSHRAGLPAVRKPLPREAFFQSDTMCAALAEQEPWWEPGKNFGYHAITYAWLVGEVIRRVSGKTPGTYFREEIVEPLGLDAHIGLDAIHDRRTADIIAAPPPKP